MQEPSRSRPAASAALLLLHGVGRPPPAGAIVPPRPTAPSCWAERSGAAAATWRGSRVIASAPRLPLGRRSLCHDLDRQGHPRRAIAFAPIRAPHGRPVAGTHRQRCILSPSTRAALTPGNRSPRGRTARCGSSTSGTTRSGGAPPAAPSPTTPTSTTRSTTRKRSRRRPDGGLWFLNQGNNSIGRIQAVEPPSATIGSPANGASYTQGQLVDPGFTCSEGTDGPGSRPARTAVAARRPTARRSTGSPRDRIRSWSPRPAATV